VIEKVKWQGKTLALILRAGFDDEGVNFVTDEASPLQVGVLKHPHGFKIKPHMHRASKKTIDSIQEVLHVEYGRVGVNFYNNSGEQIGSAVINMGDTILLIAEGHGFDMLEDSKMIEVKQGPYQGMEQDKKLLETGGD
jgi:hypothetical protein